MALPPVANQTPPTMPSQFPIRSPSMSQSSTMMRRSSEHMRAGSSSGPPHHMADNTLYEDATTLKGDYSGDAVTLKGEHSPNPSGDGHHHHHHHKLQKVTSRLETPRAWLGLQPVAPVAGDPEHAEHAHLGWSQVKLTLKEPFAEFWGTFILVLFGKYHHTSLFSSTTNASKVTLVWLRSLLDRVIWRVQVARGSVTGRASTGLSALASCWEYTLPVTVVHT